MSTNGSLEPATDDRVNDLLPRYDASGTPVTRMMRWAFQVWVIVFLFTLVFTLVVYLIDRVRG